MLIASFILVISFAALVQFAVFSWRAALLSVANSPVINEEAAAAPVYHKILETNDFQEVMSYQNVCPELGAGGGSKLMSVRVYYRALAFLSSLGKAIGTAAMETWTAGEMALCTRYAAVVMIQRLERNQVLASDMRGF
jgi:hypothetical protein